MVATKKRVGGKDVKPPTPKEVEENLKRANLPKEQSAKYHPYYQGKIEIVPRVPVRSFNDFAIWYTPGVAQPCLDIAADPSKVWTLTNKWNQVAIVTDGTRVLGLGDIGPEAGLPVMEGKSLLFKYLGGVDAFPIPLATKDPEKIIETVKLITPSFGGVNLEDIAQPKCFHILQRLRKECEIAVWHDDQQGTATINVAGLIEAWTRRDSEGLGRLDGGRRDPLRDREPRAGDLAMGSRGGRSPCHRHGPVRFPESGEQQPGVPRDFSRHAGRACTDDHGRDVHRRSGGAREGRGGKGPRRDAHRAHDG